MWWHLWWQQTLTPESTLGACLCCHVSDEVRSVLCTISNYTWSVSEAFGLLEIVCAVSVLTSCSPHLLFGQKYKRRKAFVSMQPNKHTVHCLSAEVGHKIISNMIRFADDLHAHSTVFFPTQQLKTVKPVGGVQPLACSFSSSSLWLSILFHDTLSKIRVYRFMD